MRHITALTALSLFIGLGLLTEPVEAKTVNVNCDLGMTVSAALANAKTGKPLIVHLEGVC